MPDHDPAPDPIDEAYVRAEALLDDGAQRAARRARVLAAVAREPAPAVEPPGRAPAWRRGGWLAAACVVGLSVFVVAQIYRPPPPPQPRGPAASSEAPTPAVVAPPAVAPGPPASSAPGPSSDGQAAQTPQAQATPAPSQVTANASKAVAAAPAPVPSIAPAPPPAAPPPPTEAPARGEAVREEPVVPPSADEVTTAQRAAPAPASTGAENVGEITVTGSKREARPAGGRFGALGGFSADATAASDPAVRLRAAAAAGRTAEVESLLRKGAPADAPDDDGDTALIEAVRSDHAAAAAALRRHGASLDHRNNAGESARDIAAAKDDAALDKALGMAP